MRQADLGRVALFTFAFVALLVACNSNAPAPVVENVDATGQPLLMQGQACNQGNQCTSGFCVDTVCCNTACGNGARDNMVCSNIYTGAQPIVGGTCVTLAVGDACGALEGLNPCTWRGSNINGGNNCPAPGNGTPAKACYTCSAGNNTCPPGLPICSQVNGVYGCSVCSADFGSGAAGACPTSDFPVCETLSGACVECTATKPGACAAQGKACDPTVDKCVACLTDNNGLPLSVGECPTNAPFCINPGVNSTCVQCKAGGVAVCTALGQVCDTGTNTCVDCLSSTDCKTAANPICDTATNKCVACAGDRLTGPAPQCPTAPLPACVSGACKQCSTTDQTACAGVTPKCDTANNVCVECNVNGDCAAGKPFCVAHTCSNACLTDLQCTSPTAPKCGVDGLCHECIEGAPLGDALCKTPALAPKTICSGTSCTQCKTFADCGGPTPVCDTVQGLCVACGGNFPVAGGCQDATAPACKATGACVQCTSQDDILCMGATDVCNTTTDKCVECTAGDSSACVGGKPVCNLATSTCVACNGDNGEAVTAACPSQDAPACVSGKCVQCSAAKPNLTACTDPAKTVCNAANMCAQCTSDVQCAGNVLGVCDLATNRCTAGCVNDSNCLSTPATPKCKTAPAPSKCVQCLDSSQCGGATPSCDPATNTCVACLTDAACGGTTPVCKTGVCVACDGDRLSGTPAACKLAATPACVPAGADKGKCVACTTQDPVLCVGATPACNDTSHTCVQCGSNAQCSGTTPICNAAGTCVKCDGDLGAATPAACTTAIAPACLTAGAKLGACVECSGANATLCKNQKPVCDTTANLCVQCNTNAQCTGPNGVCNTVAHVCTLGCTTDANCTMAAPACKTPDDFCVQCTATNKTACVGATPVCDVANNTCVGCNTGVDCPGGTPVCDPVTRTCTADCKLSSQCPGDAPVCDPVTKHCVGCVTIADCKEPTPICNTVTHMCGTDCTKSSECPGSAPICNPATKKCVDCTSNTDCPAGQICNTTTNKCGTDCSKSSECPGDAPICDPKNHQCVGCVDDTSCPATAPLCDGTTRKCVADDTSSIEGGGCACSTVPSGGTTTLPVLVGLGLALTAFARRRRNRDLTRRA